MRQLSFVFIFLFVCTVSDAQSISDVPGAFMALKEQPEVIQLKKGHLKTPGGGHLQGIQCYQDSLFVITASSSKYAYCLIGNTQNITAVQKLSDAPYRHAGGCQMMASELFVGVEDNKAKNKSNILVMSPFFADLRATMNPIIHRQGTFKRSTAGATAVVQAKTGCLLAVGAWDSRDIDFYIARSVGPVRFDSLTTFHAPAGEKWVSYQSINMLTDASGKLYMIGLGLDGTDDRADLFEVTISADKADLKLINTRTFKCKGTSFRYGAGISVTENRKLVIYSCARNAGASTAINIFR